MSERTDYEGFETIRSNSLPPLVRVCDQQHYSLFEVVVGVEDSGELFGARLERPSVLGIQLDACGVCNETIVRYTQGGSVLRWCPSCRLEEYGTSLVPTAELRGEYRPLMFLEPPPEMKL